MPWDKYLSVNTVEYSNETNINDAINSVYEHIDNVNSNNDIENNSICGDSAITDSMDNNLDNIGNETEKKKKNKRRGKKQIGQSKRQSKNKRKLNIIWIIMKVADINDSLVLSSMTSD